MAVSINWGAIDSKISSATKTTKFKKAQKTAVKNMLMGRLDLQGSGTVHTPEEAAEKFIEVLKSHIGSAGLSANAAAAISNLTYGSPSETDTGATITIEFVGTARPSLQPYKYGGIEALEELFDVGTSHVMNRVYGIWHGEAIGSKTFIPGAHFLEAAKNDFMSAYADEYGVRDVDISYTGG